MNLYYKNPYTDPYFNMAVEEYLFNNYDEPIFHVWRNESCVVVGKNQLLANEIDSDYTAEHNIHIVRRFTGGGAVYQDLGNINFTFFNSNSNIHFDGFNQKLLTFLETTYKLNLSTNERRAIFINDLKISGSAQHIRGHKAVYHATLLFDSNLQHLNSSLAGKELENSSKKYVKSVKSPTVNLIEYLPKNITIDQIMEDAILFFTKVDAKKIILTANELKKILTIKEEKYGAELWIEKE